MKAFSVAAVLMAKQAAAAGSCPTSHADAASCDQDADCTWCKCAALPSACWLKTDAATLPAAVYQCDGAVQDEPNNLACDLCTKVTDAAIGKSVEECEALCKKTGSFDETCEDLCGTVSKDCAEGADNCAEKVCEKVKLCPHDDHPDNLPCDVCTKVTDAAIGKSVEECEALCKKTGSFDETCEDLCGTVSKDCAEGADNCPEKVCEKVKLCPRDDHPDNLPCDVCTKVAGAAIGKSVEECEALCKKTGGLDDICEDLCGTVSKDCAEGADNCPEKVCEKVKLCPKDVVV